MTAPTALAVSEEQVYAALKRVIDPELGINIVDLGLIYSVDISPEGQVEVTMTLTTAGCPLQASFSEAIERALWQTIPNLAGVSMNIVWEPPWNPDMVSAEGRELLGMN